MSGVKCAGAVFQESIGLGWLGLGSVGWAGLAWAGLASWAGWAGPAGLPVLAGWAGWLARVLTDLREHPWAILKARSQQPAASRPAAWIGKGDGGWKMTGLGSVRTRSTLGQVGELM